MERFRVQIAANGGMASSVDLRQQLHGAGGGLLMLESLEKAEAMRTRLRTIVIGAASLADALAKLSDHGLPAHEATCAVGLGLEVAL